MTYDIHTNNSTVRSFVSIRTSPIHVHVLHQPILLVRLFVCSSTIYQASIRLATRPYEFCSRPCMRTTSSIFICFENFILKNKFTAIEPAPTEYGPTRLSFKTRQPQQQQTTNNNNAHRNVVLRTKNYNTNEAGQMNEWNGLDEGSLSGERTTDKTR